MIFSPRLHRSGRLARIALALSAAAALALCITPLARASSTTVPAGGNFEQSPPLYSTVDECGLLCSISSTVQAEGSNRYLRTSYSSLLGAIGTSAGTASISSPQFTWNEATPSAIELMLDRRASLGSLAEIDGGATFTATLDDVTAGTSTTIASEAMGSSEPTFHAYETAVSPSLLTDGHTYRLIVTEQFSALAGVITSASVDVDNVGLDVTSAPSTDTIGITSLSAPGEHAVTASAMLETHGEETTYALEYGTTTDYGSETTLQSIPSGQEGSQQISATISGLAPSTTYHARFVASDAGGTSYGSDVQFTTAPASPPTVGVASVDDVTAGGAIVVAVVNPGSNETSVQVEYGTGIFYTNSTPPQTIAAGSGPTSVQIQLSGLSTGTTYRARLVAVNADGKAESEELTFATGSGGGPSSAEIGPSSASGVGERSATLGTSVDTHGESATYEVQYGTSTGYGSSTTVQALGAGSSSFRALSVPLTGLAPGTTYHARFVVVDAGGTANGIDVVFTTSARVAPSIASASIATLSESAATVDATVDPGANETSVTLDYGTSTAYGQSTSAVTVPANNGATVVQLPIGGLTADTAYHVKVLATSADGGSESGDLTFTTPTGSTELAGAGEPPSIAASTIGEIGEQSAVARADIDTHGQAATYEVQYGPTSSYGETTSAQAIAAGAGPTAVQIPIVGLVTATQYHARFRAITAGGTSYGLDITFTTLAGAVGNGAQSSGAGTGSGSNRSVSLTPGSSALQCLEVQTRRRGLAARLLSSPAAARISASRPLVVALTRAARSATRVRFALGTRALAGTTRHTLRIAPSQLQAGRGTVLHVLVTLAHRKVRSLQVELDASPCGATLVVRRRGARLQVAVRRLIGSGRVTFTLPIAVGAARAGTLMTTSGNRHFRVRSLGGHIRLAPRADRLSISRSGRTLTVANLPSSSTGLVLEFSTRRLTRAAVIARVTSASGSTQSLTAVPR